MKQVTIHKNLRPLKPIIKGSKNQFSMAPGQILNDDTEQVRKSSQFNGSGAKDRVHSADQKNNVQIITKKVNNYITNNINNIIISPNFKTFQEFLEETKNNQNSNQEKPANESLSNLSLISNNNKVVIHN